MKIFLGDQTNAEKMLRPDSGFDFAYVFGTDIGSIFKPFTTQFNSAIFPSYFQSVFASGALAGSGFFTGADSSGLNPYGNNTLGEGIIYGANRTGYRDDRIDAGTVRSIALKNPTNIVGWGYDIWGYPAPNNNRAWTVSGTFASGTPANTFAGNFAKGTDVAPANFVAGPLDLRFDNDRKVWTSPISVRSANIIRAYASGVPITDFGQPQLDTDIRYDVKVFDGIAAPITVTGLRHVGPRPYGSSFKVMPLSSGSFALLVHVAVSGKPGYGVFVVEPPATTGCPTTSTTSRGDGTDPADEYLSRNFLATNVLETEYGGTGFDFYSSGVILIGDLSGSGNLQQKRLTVGSGMVINMHPTGTTVNIALSTGISFNSAGINTTITQLQGLTTPLSIPQGGTGATGIIWFNLTDSQSCSGIKQFQSPIRAASGTTSQPSISFSNSIRTGFSNYVNNSGMYFSVSGERTQDIFTQKTDIRNSLTITSDILPLSYASDYSVAPLVVKQYPDTSYFHDIAIWYDRAGGKVLKVDQIGTLWSRRAVISTTGLTTVTGNLLSVERPTNLIGNSISCSGVSDGVYFSVNNNGTEVSMGPSGQNTKIISTTGNITINFASGYNGDIAVAKVGGGTRTLKLYNGLITGYVDS